MSEIVKQITKAFEDEQKNPKIAVEASDLPLSYETMSPVWLTNVLCAATPGFKVVSIELGPTDSGSTNRRGVRLSYQPDDTQGKLPTRVFCKATHLLENRLLCGLFGALHAEVTFYNVLRPQLAIETPQCYFAAYDDYSYNSMVILEDVSGRIEGFGSHKTKMNQARVQSQLSILANVHGPFYRSKSLDTTLSMIVTWPNYFRNALRFNLETATIRGFDGAREVIPARLYERKHELWPAIVAAVDQHNQLPQTISHNDVHLGNWYVVNGDTMGISDWGCCTRGHWSRDVAYTLATALSVEDRRRWEKDLLQYYLDRLALHGVLDTNFDQAWLLYRKQLLSLIPWWTPAYSPEENMPEGMQPLETVKEFIHRITTAIDDLDALDLF